MEKINTNNLNNKEIGEGNIEKMRDFLFKYPFLIINYIREFLLDEKTEDRFFGDFRIPADVLKKTLLLKKEHSRDFFLKIYELIDSNFDLSIMLMNQAENDGLNINESCSFSVQLADSQHELSQDDIDRMIGIYENNYKNQPKLQSVLLDNFKKTLKSDDYNTEFYLVKHGEELAGFFLMKYDIEKDEQHLMSFNIDPRYAGKGLGSSGLRDQLNGLARFHRVSAETKAQNGLSSYYIEKFKFVATGSFELGDQKCFSIYRNDSQDVFKSKKIPLKHFINAAVFNEISQLDDGIKVAMCDDENYSRLVDKGFENGSYLTRCFRYMSNEGTPINLLVFEKISFDDSEKYMNVFDYDNLDPNESRHAFIV
jgi:hypothetical protein